MHEKKPRCLHTWRDHVIGHEHRCGYNGGHRTSIHNCWCGAALVGPKVPVQQNRNE